MVLVAALSAVVMWPTVPRAPCVRLRERPDSALNLAGPAGRGQYCALVGAQRGTRIVQHCWSGQQCWPGQQCRSDQRFGFTRSTRSTRPTRFVRSARSTRWATAVGIVLAALALALFGSPSAGAAVRVATLAELQAVSLPAPGVCSDDQGVLGKATCARVAALLAADEQATTDEIAVLVIGSTGSQSIERYATQVFNSWGLGKAGVDNGVLVVVAFDDRAMRIEVGDGLSARLPDGQAREIVGGTMLPAFRSGDYRYGVLAGLDAVRTALGYQLIDQDRMTAIPKDAGYDAPSPSSAAPPTRSSSRDSAAGSSGSDSNTVLWAVIIAIGAAAALLSWLFKGGGGGGDDGDGGDGSGGSGWSNRRTYRSFSSRSSSSRRSSSSSRRSSFGGGRSSGGGASGRW